MGRMPRTQATVPARGRVGRTRASYPRFVPVRSNRCRIGSASWSTSPRPGPARVATLRISETKGNLPAKLNAQLAWVSARADCAWYALAHAHDRLRVLGLDDETIFAIDQASESRFTPGERTAFAFARKLTVDPALIGDADFDDLRKFYSESEIAELIYHVNHDVFFNRVTEAAQLTLEGSANGTVSHR